MPGVYEHRHVVLAEEIDALGHASNLAYLAWMQAAALAHSAAQGWPAPRYHELGAGWVVRSHQIEYLRPAFAGQALVVRTWVAGFRKVTSLRRYQIIRPADDRVLATAATDWAFVNYRTGQPTRVPPEGNRSHPELTFDRKLVFSKSAISATPEACRRSCWSRKT